MSPVACIFLFTLFSLHTFDITSGKPPDETLNDDERNALQTFIKKVRHTKKLEWKDSEPACSWKGVICDPGNKTVLYLRLPAKSFIGEIPNKTIGMLSNLRVLSLRINNLSGSIPADFSNLASLTRLHLFSNSFTGQLPFIKFKVKLIALNVSSNKLNSSIPSSLSMFDISAFSPNVFLCGKPFNRCNDSYPSPDMEPDKKNTGKNKRVIVGISVGSGLLLLLLLCCVQKRLYEESKETTKLPSVASGAASKAGTSTQEGKNKLEFFENEIFDLEDLLKASAEILGEGSFGISYKQVVEERKTTIVVKRLKDVKATEVEFTGKMKVLGGMKNKNLVPLKAYYYSEKEKLLVYDYMAGSLSARLHGSKRPGQTQLDWHHRKRVALAAARGLAYLHVQGKLVHGNIKSSNILLGQETNNEAFVSDYGLNTLFKGSSLLNNGYRAPEVSDAQKVTFESSDTQKVTFESDVYSFGVLLLELLTGETPNQVTLGKRSKWVESLVSGGPKAEMFDVELQLDHNIEEMMQLLQIAKDCVSIEPDQRPAMHHVVSMMEDIRLRPSSDDYSKEYEFTPSTDTRDTPSTITP